MKLSMKHSFTGYVWRYQGIKQLFVYGDSLLVVQQVNKEWDCNKEMMDAYV
jgi:hypothetical protein